MCEDNEDIIPGLDDENPNEEGFIDDENPNEEGFIDDDCEPIDPWYRFGERTTGPI